MARVNRLAPSSSMALVLDAPPLPPAPADQITQSKLLPTSSFAESSVDSSIDATRGVIDASREVPAADLMSGMCAALRITEVTVCPF